MDRIGVSFQSSLSADEVRARYIVPLRAALEQSRLGIYSNYLRQFDEGETPEHLIVFQVHDFQAGLRALRTTLEALDRPQEIAFHNLNASDPMY